METKHYKDIPLGTWFVIKDGISVQKLETNSHAYLQGYNVSSITGKCYLVDENESYPLVDKDCIAYRPPFSS